MQKYFAQGTFYKLPSGNEVHPHRLIVRDGSLSWRDACYNSQFQVVNIPQELAHEQHILKTCQRLEELNTWIEPVQEPWDRLKTIVWYEPREPELAEGISLYFTHKIFSKKATYKLLIDHILPHETLEIRDNYLFFKRC